VTVPLQPVIERYASVARAEILRDHVSDSCIASTWITVQVFRSLGYETGSLEVRLSVGNVAYREERDRRGPPQSPDELERWAEEEGAHVIGIGFDPPGPGIGGHLVAVVEGFLIDASIDQGNDPKHGIMLPAVLWGHMDPSFLSRRKDLNRMDTGGMFIEYSHHPTGIEYAASYDWGHNSETDAAVSRILGELAT